MLILLVCITAAIAFPLLGLWQIRDRLRSAGVGGDGSFGSTLRPGIELPAGLGAGRRRVTLQLEVKTSLQGVLLSNGTETLTANFERLATPLVIEPVRDSEAAGRRHGPPVPLPPINPGSGSMASSPRSWNTAVPSNNAACRSASISTRTGERAKVSMR